MTNVDRQKVFDDSDFECALAADGTSPAVALLYRDGNDDEVCDLDMRPRDWTIFEDLLEAVDAGEDLPLSRHNYLQDGLWELKVYSLRATFYDTDGSGSYTAKRGREYWEAGRGRRRVYVPEEMDIYLRLGHWFEKSGQKTAQGDLEAALRLREEDLEHDNPTQTADTAIEVNQPGAIEGSSGGAAGAQDSGSARGSS